MKIAYERVTSFPWNTLTSAITIKIKLHIKEKLIKGFFLPFLFCSLSFLFHLLFVKSPLFVTFTNSSWFKICPWCLRVRACKDIMNLEKCLFYLDLCTFCSKMRGLPWVRYLCNSLPQVAEKFLVLQEKVSRSLIRVQESRIHYQE